jgi:predicted Holliday junction resolvase-like endonuclease
MNPVDARLIVHISSVILMFSFVYWALKSRIYKMEKRIEDTFQHTLDIEKVLSNRQRDTEQTIKKRDNVHKDILEAHSVRITRLETHIEYQTKAADENKKLLQKLDSKLDSIREDFSQVKK